MELYSFEQLVTMAGVSTLAFLIVANTKDLPGIKQFRTFLWTAFVAFAILCVSNIALGADYANWRLYVLCFFNGWLVAAVTGKMNDKAVESAKKVI